MAHIEDGNDTAGKANVDANFNLGVNLPLNEDIAGFTVLALERDAGVHTGSRNVVKPRISAQGRLTVGQPVPLLQETFNYGSANTGLWDTTTSTFTTAVSGGFFILNNTAVTTANAVARLLTRQSFPLFSDFGLVGQATGQISQVPQANNVMEIGFFISSGTTAPTDGVLFRYDATGTLKAVINHNGTEITSSAITGHSDPATRYVWRIEIEDDVAWFKINNDVVASISVPDTNGKPYMAEALPFQCREYNSASTPAVASQLKIASIYVGLQDAAGMSLPAAVAMAGMGRTAVQGQSGHTQGSTANYQNSTNPTAAVPTNTTAALGSGLGGQFWETDTLAVTTDGIISSYQNPAGTAAISGKTLMITSVTIDSYVQTALTGGGYIAQWSLAVGHTAVSLGTAEAAATKAPRRVPLGIQSVASAAAALTVLSQVRQTFDAPIPVMPGEFIATVKKKVGTAPSAGVIAHVVTFNGYFL
jgi:hypothetical protein